MMPKILFGTVMHKRLFPRVNAFHYGIYNISIPLSKLNTKIENSYFKYNRWGLLSFYNKDHGYRTGENPQLWAQKILTDYNIQNMDGEIILVTLPRVFGYVFNPVSFYYCFDKGKKLRAVICEVNNTFGETHAYLCAYPDGREIIKGDTLCGDKVFHVSPFLKREGYYEFKFDVSEKHMIAHIDFYNADGQKQLVTSLNGKFETLNEKNTKCAFWKYPLVTVKAIMLIHWQAIKLVIKKIRYISKPDQKNISVTGTTDMKDNNKHV